MPYDDKLFETGMHCGPFFIFDNKLIDKIGYFNDQFMIAGDFDWCVRAAGAKVRFRKSIKLGGVFKVHDNNLTNIKNINLHIVENEVIYRTHRIKDKFQDLNNEQNELLKNYKITK
jgi:GT2 family glycosyltransferase